MCIICRKEYNENTTEIKIYNCGKIQEIPKIPRLEILKCWNCPELQKIPVLPELRDLNCSLCINLQEIPLLPKLIKLSCMKCYELQEIPLLPRLEALNCSICRSLREIPMLPRLKILWCEYCPNLVIQPNKLLEFGYKYSNCHWLKEDTIQKVTSIQRYLRKYLRFLAYTRKPRYSTWLYAPDGPLGRKFKKRLETTVWTKDQE